MSEGQETKQVCIVTKDGADIPVLATKNSAGFDVSAYLDGEVVIEPGCSELIPTGIFLEIPNGYEMQIRPRSGLALRNQVTVLNTPGTIDADYRGEIKVILINHGRRPFSVLPGMRIAQLVLAKVFSAEFVRINELSLTSRGDGGFGHTGG